MSAQPPRKAPWQAACRPAARHSGTRRRHLLCPCSALKPPPVPAPRLALHGQLQAGTASPSPSPSPLPHTHGQRPARRRSRGKGRPAALLIKRPINRLRARPSGFGRRGSAGGAVQPSPAVLCRAVPSRQESWGCRSLTPPQKARCPGWTQTSSWTLKTSCSDPKEAASKADQRWGLPDPACFPFGSQPLSAFPLTLLPPFFPSPLYFYPPGVTSQCPPRSKRPLRAGGVMVAGGCRRSGQEGDGVAGPRRFFVEKKEKKMKEKGCRGCWGRCLLPTGASAGSQRGWGGRGGFVPHKARGCMSLLLLPARVGLHVPAGSGG